MKVIRLAIRSILHFRTYSMINLIGLALGLACVMIISRYVYGELTVDRFNKNLDRMYVITSEKGTNPGDVMFLSSFPLIPDKNFDDLTGHPGVERYTNFIPFGNEEIDVEGRIYDVMVLVADSNFLQITGYPVVLGAAGLSDPNGALITKKIAQKLFGQQNPVGKSFRYLNGQMLTVAGIIGDITTKSSLSFDIIVPYSFTTWTRVPQSYVLLHKDADYLTINKLNETTSETSTQYQLYPLSKVYFERNIRNFGDFKQGNYNYVVVLMCAGLLILLAGIINYMNIYTVVVLRRGRELSIKRVFGAGGHHIFSQILTENTLLTGIALLAALFIVRMAHPLVANRLQLDLMPDFRFDLFLSITLLFVLPAITTLYPFLQHRYSMPVNSLRNLDKIRGKGFMRHVFLSFQYVISIAMIIVSLFFIKQLQFMLNTDPGYRTADIIKVQFQRYNYSTGSYEQEALAKERETSQEIKQKMDACPLFTNWTYKVSPNEIGRGSKAMFKLPDDEYKEITWTNADENWFKLFDIPLKAGAFWNELAQQDIITRTPEGRISISSPVPKEILVTESFIKMFGISDINNTILLSRRNSPNDVPVRIIGVVKDLHYSHLSQKANPVVFYYSSSVLNTDPIVASIVPGRSQDAIDFLRNLHEETVGGEFSYSFVEDEVHAMYVEDKKITTIYTIFTFIAIFISVLGLFSMSLFDMQQRRKEIAIRKVNGATFHDIIRLLLKKYCLSLIISFAIASPIALLAINRYLEDFANKAPVSWWLFAVAVVLTTGISLLTLIYQTVRAANQNPAEVVKAE